eukprot:SAG31_NODE_2844_length_5009_cov_2.067006_7_plen_125_part_00
MEPCDSTESLLDAQVCDMRRHTLIEAHVRCYCVRREPDFTGVPYLDGFYYPHLMRLQQPDDELSGMLLLNVPNIIVHAIDSWSPLAPPVPPARTPRDNDRSSSGGRSVPLDIISHNPLTFVLTH